MNTKLVKKDTISIITTFLDALLFSGVVYEFVRIIKMFREGKDYFEKAGDKFGAMGGDAGAVSSGLSFLSGLFSGFLGIVGMISMIVAIVAVGIAFMLIIPNIIIGIIAHVRFKKTEQDKFFLDSLIKLILNLLFAFFCISSVNPQQMWWLAPGSVAAMVVILSLINLCTVVKQVKEKQEET